MITKAVLERGSYAFESPQAKTDKCTLALIEWTEEVTLIFPHFLASRSGCACLHEKNQSCTMVNSERGDTHQLLLSPHVFNSLDYVTAQSVPYM